MNKPETCSAIVVVSDDGLKEIESLAERLRETGFVVKRVLPITGVISGTCSKLAMQAILEMEGVEGVEEELEAKLPPPNGPQ